MSKVLKLLILSVTTIISCANSKSQTVYFTKFPSNDTYKVYEVSNHTQADLLVYRTKYKSQAKGNRGMWHITPHQTANAINVYVVPYRNQADFSIYYVNHPNESKWKTKIICLH